MANLQALCPYPASQSAQSTLLILPPPNQFTASCWGDSDRIRERAWRGDDQWCAISRANVAQTCERHRTCTGEQAWRRDGQWCAADLWLNFCNFPSHG